MTKETYGYSDAHPHPFIVLFMERKCSLEFGFTKPSFSIFKDISLVKCLTWKCLFFIQVLWILDHFGSTIWLIPFVSKTFRLPKIFPVEDQDSEDEIEGMGTWKSIVKTWRTDVIYEFTVNSGIENEVERLDTNKVERVLQQKTITNNCT